MPEVSTLDHLLYLNTVFTLGRRLKRKVRRSCARKFDGDSHVHCRLRTCVSSLGEGRHLYIVEKNDENH